MVAVLISALSVRQSVGQLPTTISGRYGPVLWSVAELSMGRVDPRVGLGRDFSVFAGLGWVHCSKSSKIC